MAARLMCATDLTARSDHAVTRAALLAKQMSAKVLLVHAVDDSQPGRVIRMRANRAQARLMSQAERMMKHASQDVEIAVRLGKPLQVIAGIAKEWSSDMVVMAAPRPHRRDYIIGTTAERVIRATHRPVLVVSTAAQDPYGRVVIASDPSEMSKQIARTVGAMGVLNGAYAWVVHSFDPPFRGLLTTEAHAECEIEDHKRRWRDAVTSGLVRDLVGSGVDPNRIQVSVEAARPVDAIHAAMSAVEPELLVIGVSRWFMLNRLLFGSVAQQVLQHAKCDVLAISPAVRRKNWLRAA
ncbi:MAG TPA: universal stress protein [Steroidobacter sp.]|jgi:nucleotide-binding universal stress UspA family protein|nr:universal stress protein [Steroidobacteraceae bacterium]HLS82934.1 universal stress protein [Steroidobacter sp.]